MGDIKFIVTSVFEGGGGMDTCVDFFSMNHETSGLCIYKLFM